MRKDESKAPLGLYVHIPFCVRKCLYCDFLSFPASEIEKERYCKSLRRELAMWAEDERIRGREVDTVFFGGGTPSCLEPALFSAVMQDIREHFLLTQDAEISLECNPGTVDKEKFKVYRQFGVNRISMGMQSVVDAELQALGRIHSGEDFGRAFEEARECGFENINADVMSAIPGQTLASYRETLQNVLERKPEHISSYSLILEEGTPFYEMYKDKPPVDEETDRRMYEQTGEMLSAAGYERYEISNYARDGRVCRHNLKYWHRQEYVGAGLGAASFLQERRLTNERDFSAYQEKLNQCRLPVAGTEILSGKDAMAEFMYLGLRCMKGVSAQDFHEKFGVVLSEIYGNVIEKYSALGLIERKGDRIALTRKGIDVSNVIFADFI